MHLLGSINRVILLCSRFIRIKQKFIIGATCLSLVIQLIALHPIASAAPGNILPPFDPGQQWNICQGYNGPVSHMGTSQYGLDLTGSGCGNSAAGRNVRAPIAGNVYYYQASYGNLCVNIPGNHSYTLTHINSAITSGTVSAGQVVGNVASANQRNNGGVAHIHFQIWSTPNCYSSSGMPFDGAHGARICGAPDLTPGGAGSNGNWSGTSFVGATCDTGPATGPDDPKGNFESMQQVNGGVRLTGWALDPNTSSSVAIHVYEGGCCSNPRGAYTADVPRGDVGVAFPGYGDLHGFDFTLPLPNGVSGSKTYCAYAINVGAGNVSPELGCRTVTFNWNPIGNYEGIRRVPGGAKLSGWTLDPDTAQPIAIHVYEGGCCSNPRGAYTADLSRPDVGAAFTYGDLHGFDLQVAAYPTSSTQKTYCVYAINTGYGNSSPELGCRSITISPDTEGNFEAIEAVAGGARIIGWALDPDIAGSNGIHVYENGSLVAINSANISRPDVASYWPDYGNLHGFDFTIPLSAGSHNLCAYSVNDPSTPGISKNLGCRLVTVS